jgi:non-reducing end alpha-L-arabinofuranosidase
LLTFSSAIILGIGGDNSNSAEGTFYEGAMTSGYPSDETEDEVQADIVAAGYSTGPAMTC